MFACLSATINPNWYFPGVGMEKNTLLPQDADADLISSGMIQTLLSPTASSCDKKTSVPASAVVGPLIADLISWERVVVQVRSSRLSASNCFMMIERVKEKEHPTT